MILLSDEFYNLIIGSILDIRITYFLNKIYHLRDSSEADNYSQNGIN